MTKLSPDGASGWMKNLQYFKDENADLILILIKFDFNFLNRCFKITI